MYPTSKENRSALVEEKSVTWTSNKSSLVVLHSKVQIPERFSFREGTREKERKREVERLRYRFSNMYLTSHDSFSFILCQFSFTPQVKDSDICRTENMQNT